MSSRCWLWAGPFGSLPGRYWARSGDAAAVDAVRRNRGSVSTSVRPSDLQPSNASRSFLPTRSGYRTIRASKDSQSVPPTSPPVSFPCRRGDARGCPILAQQGWGMDRSLDGGCPILWVLPKGGGRMDYLRASDVMSVPHPSQGAKDGAPTIVDELFIPRRA